MAQNQHKSPNNEPFKGVFAKMDFPSYEYEHYPLMLTKGNGKTDHEQLVVNDAEEEKAAIADGWIAPKRVGPTKTLTQHELDEKDAEIEALKRQLLAAQSGRTEFAPPSTMEQQVPPEQTGAKAPLTQPGEALKAPASASGSNVPDAPASVSVPDPKVPVGTPHLPGNPALGGQPAPVVKK